MICRASELYNKEVICVRDGSKLGVMSDVDVNVETGFIESVIIYGRPRFFGLFGRDDDMIIAWSQIEVLGDETVLVNCDPPRGRVRSRCRKNTLKNFFDF